MLSIGHEALALVAAVGADHRAAATGGEAILLLAIPILWLIGVAVFVALKFRAH
jgi:hypothetical protein